MRESLRERIANSDSLESQLFAAGLVHLQQLFADIHATSRAEIAHELERHTAEAKEQLAELDAAWERKFGDQFPTEIEDLERWAVRIGMDPDWVRKGDWRPDELMPLIEGYLQRQADTKGQTKDTPKDKTKKLPRNDRTRGCIQYVNSHRRKVKKGEVSPMALRDLVAEFAGEFGTKEVDRLYRALQPDRHGPLLVAE